MFVKRLDIFNLLNGQVHAFLFFLLIMSSFCDPKKKGSLIWL